MSLKKWFSGSAGDANSEDQVTVSAAELSELKADMQAAQEKLEAAEEENAQLKEQNGTLSAKVEELQGSVSAKEEEISQKDAEIVKLKEKLEEKPAGQATTVVPRDEYEKENPYKTSVDAELEEKIAKAKSLNLN